MKFNPNLHHRRSIRLKGYDYSQNGAYFITICVQHKECRFGKIENGKMELNEAGEMIEKWWEEMEKKFPNISLDASVVMPNHFHGIIVIDNNREQNISNRNVGAPLVGAQFNIKKGQAQENFGIGQAQEILKKGQAQGAAPTSSIGDIVGAFKSLTTNEYIHGVKSEKYSPFDKRLWQRNYHEHIIRNEKSFEMIHHYILQNPEKWEEDCFYIFS